MQAPSPLLADYVIDIDDHGFTRAFCGKSHALLIRDTDASTVIQHAIDALPVTGGKIYLSSGAYELTRTILIEDKHGVHLEGSARGLLFTGGRAGTVLRSHQAIDLLCIFGKTLKVAGITLNNLHLMGSGKDNGKAGLLLLGDTDVLSMHQVGANNNGVGFHFKGGSGTMLGVIDAAQVQCCDPQCNGIGMLLERCHYTKIIGGEFSDCVKAGIVLSAPDAGHGCLQGVKIIGITCLRNGEAGIRVGRNCDEVTITGGCDIGGHAHGSGIILDNQGEGNPPRNVIISAVHVFNNRDAAIRIRNAEHVIVHSCILSDHPHDFVETSGQRFGLDLAVAARDILASGNIVYGNHVQDIRQDAALP